VAVFVLTLFVLQSGSRFMQGVTRSYTTGVNQQGVLTLNDGTRVTLAPQTTVRLLGFSPRARTVSVDGKAYFEVAHAGSAPFEVHGGSVTARVLGTAFLVDHALHSSHVRVAVEEGKVRVFNAARTGAAVIVTPGYVGEITDSSQLVTAVNDSMAGTEWFRGRLVFHHAPVATVLQTLSRWYGYQFRYADSTLLQRNVTVGISVRSPALALATLEQLLRVNLTVHGDTVTLAPQTERTEGRKENISRIRSYDVWTPIREVGR
jgi:transmembrane sensor